MNKATNTSTFEYTNPNPHSSIRSADCVVRSICIATGKDWYEVFDALVQIARKKGRMPNENEVYYLYLKQEGWKVQRQEKRLDGTKYTVSEFIKKIAKGRTCIISTTGHLTCCSEGKIRDTWDCSMYKAGRYWVKE